MTDVMTAVRRGNGPFRFARPLWRRLVRLRLPVIRPVYGMFWAIGPVWDRLWTLFAKIVYREPMLRYRCTDVGRGLYLEGGVPQVFGSGRITIGEDVRIGARNTWVVGFKVSEDAELVIGNRVSINYQTTISVAKSVQIGDDTMIAGNVQIYDNISHPVSPERRLRHESFTLDESTPVVIGRNCWIGNQAILLRGVTIGDNSIVAAGAIVTKPVPANVLVAGNPARVIRAISDDDHASPLVVEALPVEVAAYAGTALFDTRA